MIIQYMDQIIIVVQTLLSVNWLEWENQKYVHGWLSLSKMDIKMSQKFW